MDSRSYPADQVRSRETKEDPAYLSTADCRPRPTRPRANSSAATGEDDTLTDNPDDGFRSDADRRPSRPSRSASLREARGGQPGYGIHPSMTGCGPPGTYGGMGYPGDSASPYDDGGYPTHYGPYSKAASPPNILERSFDFSRPPLFGSPRRGPSSGSSDETRADQPPRSRKSTRPPKPRDPARTSTSGAERPSVDAGQSEMHRRRDIPSIRLDTTATNQKTCKIKGKPKSVSIGDIQSTMNDQGDGITIKSLDGLLIKKIIHHDQWDSESGHAATIVFAKPLSSRDDNFTQEEEDSPVRVTLSEANCFGSLRENGCLAA
ncbi:hypothetical protein I203_101208 [Kwoniella mangroviensis CBS 8507]|uniref:uncharacterized protein n=1 Tax=Kwoniella mangroviensis CBS 8507 TaxID=1296122 RepID=UPI00080D795D|nr:uncharacterized protein I203_02843 [Kwoniella mangroviensis CBS 8507]OCF68181.1 hypothetical protein I203_02843 [Kwoniella mangroviensis CBS 8507]